MSHRVYDNGVWKEANGTWVYDAGVWKPVDAGWVYDAGIWKPFHTSIEGHVVVGGSQFGAPTNQFIHKLKASDMSTVASLDLSAQVTSLHRAADGFVYVGLTTGVIHKIDPISFTSVGSVAAHGAQIISMTSNTSGDTLWAGTSSSARRINTTTMSLTSTYPTSASEYVAWSADKLFILSSFGLSRWDAISNMFETSVSISGSPTAILAGGNGDIYTADTVNMARYNPTTLSVINSFGVSSNQIAKFEWNDNFNTLYISGYNISLANGFVDYRNPDFTIITSPIYVVASSITGLTMGPGDYLYSVSNSGSIRRDPILLTQSASGVAGKFIVRGD